MYDCSRIFFNRGFSCFFLIIALIPLELRSEGFTHLEFPGQCWGDAVQGCLAVHSLLSCDNCFMIGRDCYRPNGDSMGSVTSACSPCPSGLSRNQESGFCEDSNGCKDGQFFYNGQCHDFDECPNGQRIYGASDPIAACSDQDEGEPRSCPDDQVWEWVAEACIAPDGSSSSSSSTSSSSSSSSTSSSDQGDSSNSSSSDSSSNTSSQSSSSQSNSDGSDSSDDSGSGDGGSGSSVGSGGGNGDDNEGSATASGDCSVEPECSGDAVLCAQLKQIWLVNCSKSVSNESDCSQELVCEGDAIVCMGIQYQKDVGCAWEKEKVLGDLRDFAIDHNLDGIDEDDEVVYESVDLQNIVGDFLNDTTPVTSACIPNETLYLNATGNLDVSFSFMCDFADVVRPWFVFFGGLLGFIYFIRIGFMG